MVSGLSVFLCWSPITLKWLGLKMLCRPLMYFISLKVGKCPANDWCFFGTCSDILLSWDGEGSYIWIWSSVPCAANLLLASYWLFALKFIKKKKEKKKEQQKVQQTWNISGFVLKLKFKTSEQIGFHFLSSFFLIVLLHCLDSCALLGVFFCSATLADQVISIWVVNVSGQFLLWSFQWKFENFLR